MASTLIVRDATLAINGAPETRAQPEVHFRSRLHEVAAFDRRTFEDCVEVLNASAGGDESDSEVLEALMILGLSQPQLAHQLGVSAVAVGRRLAARTERRGEAEYALAVLELLAEHHSGHRAVERDLAALMRRQGMVHDLVERYLVRAKGLLNEGRTAEAIAWFREVLLLDRSRKDVARMIRDLRYQEIDDKKARRSRVRVSAFVLGLSLLVSFGILREMRVREEYAALPQTVHGNLDRLNERLDALEGFVRRYPVWHGALNVLSERGQLRVEIERMRADRDQRREENDDELEDRLEQANLARERGLMRADSGDFQSALAELEKALALAPPGWEPRERVERDIAAVRKYLEEGQR